MKVVGAAEEVGGGGGGTNMGWVSSPGSLEKFV
jgi:hypothetical protein